MAGVPLFHFQLWRNYITWKRDCLRLNELMQTRVSKERLVRLVDDSPPGAKDRSPRIRYLFRLIPQGEKTDTSRNYFIGEEPSTPASHVYRAQEWEGVYDADALCIGGRNAEASGCEVSLVEESGWGGHGACLAAWGNAHRHSRGAP